MAIHVHVLKPLWNGKLLREDEIFPKVRAHTFLPYRHIGCVLRSSENPNTALLTCILHKDLLSSWDKGMGNKLSLKTYLFLFCFTTIHIRFQINFLFWKSQDLPSDCSYCPTKDQGPVIGLTLSFINFGTKFLVADLSSLVKEQAGKGDPGFGENPVYSYRASSDASISFFSVIFLKLIFTGKHLDYSVCPVKHPWYKILFSSEFLCELPMLSM